MRRIGVLIASAMIIASAIPSLAAEGTSRMDVDASAISRWTTAQSQAAIATDKEKTCRAYAASFYESVVRRQTAADRVEGERVLAVLDFVINAFNDLLATNCGG